MSNDIIDTTSKIYIYSKIRDKRGLGRPKARWANKPARPNECLISGADDDDGDYGNTDEDYVVMNLNSVMNKGRTDKIYNWPWKSCLYRHRVME